MRKPGLLFWLLLPAAVLLGLVSVGILVLLVQFIPPHVTGVAVAVLTLGLLWFLFARRRGQVLTGSEATLMGRQSSKEGLL